MSPRVELLVCAAISLYLILASAAYSSAHYTLGDQLPTRIGEEHAGGAPYNPTSGAGNGKTPLYHDVPTTGAEFGHAPGHIAFLLPGSLYVPPSDQVNYYSLSVRVITDFFECDLRRI
ncbi:hypothetical protein KEJ39_07785 [Candidatus Bathyarchaeota archaeon]|nr:hypothetical protein [Candidatus Bathyarchaeota archaeon]